MKTIPDKIADLAKEGSWLRDNFFKLVPFQSYIIENKKTIEISVVGLKAYEEPMRTNDLDELTKLNDFLIKTIKLKLPELKDYNIVIDNRSFY